MWLQKDQMKGPGGWVLCLGCMHSWCSGCDNDQFCKMLTLENGQRQQGISGYFFTNTLKPLEGVTFLCKKPQSLGVCSGC